MLPRKVILVFAGALSIALAGALGLAGLGRAAVLAFALLGVLFFAAAGAWTPFCRRLRGETLTPVPV